MTVLASTFDSALATIAAATGHSYCNPLPVKIADPFVLRVDGVYYLYGTNAHDGYRVLTSTDLVHWEDRGYAFKRSGKTWGKRYFWAPCVVEQDGWYYLFYSCVGKVGSRRTSHRVCVARSESPLGPFEDVRTPLFDLGKAVIDAHVLQDPITGRNWLYYALDCSENCVSEIYCVELSSDLLSVVGTPSACVKPSQPWEGDKWNEAPFVWKVPGGKYVMMYSARGYFDPLYSVGYATADAPDGPWTKAQGPVLRRTDDVSGPGHNCVIESPDGTELFAVYHAHVNPTGGYDRILSIDRMAVTTDDLGNTALRVIGPTSTPQPMPSGSGTEIH
jgi:beta-xylosidase